MVQAELNTTGPGCSTAPALRDALPSTPSPASGPTPPIPANDNDQPKMRSRRSPFPADAAARIYRPCRSVMTSSPKRSPWRLVFERRSTPFIEHLMGFTGSCDTLAQVELGFPTLRAAIAYAERQGLAYTVQESSNAAGDLSASVLLSGAAADAVQHGAEAAVADSRSAADVPRPTNGERAHEQVASDAFWGRLQLAWLQGSYGAVSEAPYYSAALADPEAVYSSPSEVVADPWLSLEEKRAVLRNWAWHEYLVDLATSEGMPEHSRPARLDEVELALLALEPRRRQTGPAIGVKAA